MGNIGNGSSLYSFWFWYNYFVLVQLLPGYELLVLVLLAILRPLWVTEILHHLRCFKTTREREERAREREGEREKAREKRRGGIDSTTSQRCGISAINSTTAKNYYGYHYHHYHCRGLEWPSLP